MRLRRPSCRDGRSRLARGFSLVEVLVALAVLSVGLLGAAAMLLDSLRTQAVALHQLGATQLARDMADRIRANPRGRAHYDTRNPPAGSPTCAEPGCDPAQLAAADRARFGSAARALFANRDFTASVAYEPAIGPAAPERYEITLRWRDARDAGGLPYAVTLQVLAQLPVAG